MDPFETKVTLRVVRASAGDPLLQICMRIMVGVSVGAIVVTWIVGIESMGEFPFIGKAIVIGVGWEGRRIPRRIRGARYWWGTVDRRVR